MISVEDLSFYTALDGETPEEREAYEEHAKLVEMALADHQTVQEAADS